MGRTNIPKHIADADELNVSELQEEEENHIIYEDDQNSDELLLDDVDSLMEL